MCPSPTPPSFAHRTMASHVGQWMHCSWCRRPGLCQPADHRQWRVHGLWSIGGIGLLCNSCDDHGDPPHARYVQILLRRACISHIGGAHRCLHVPCLCGSEDSSMHAGRRWLVGHLTSFIYSTRGACTYTCSVSVLFIADRRNLCKEHNKHIHLCFILTTRTH